MSFYEDYVADGLCCMTCGVYIDDPCGYPRECPDCSGTSAKPARKNKQQQVVDFVAWLQRAGATYTLRNQGYHIIITLKDGRRVDCWPTTRKWQVFGGKVSRDGRALNALVKGIQP